jgi:hypothetical protein
MLMYQPRQFHISLYFPFQYLTGNTAVFFFSKPRLLSLKTAFPSARFWDTALSFHLYTFILLFTPFM